MKLTVRDLDIRSGGANIIIINEQDALQHGLHQEDRVLIHHGKHQVYAVVDLAESEKFVKVGEIGLFEEVLAELHVKDGKHVVLHLVSKPASLAYIRKKLSGKRLNEKELFVIVDDIVKGKLSSVETTYFVAASATRGLNIKETVALTKAMIATGDTLKFPGVVADKHCTGGVAGNRTTPLIVAILTAAGVRMPKTSSRAITSPAGTADTMEVLAPVMLSKQKMENIVNKIGGCIVWGGSINLAPADDKIIRVEKPLSIDAEGQLLASILAKKGSVGSTHVLIDIPIGKQTKILNRKQANHLRDKFKKIGKELGMKIEVMISSGNEPIGNGIGPSLEARDILWILERDSRRPLDLEEKSVRMAGMLLKLAGKGNEKLAREILESGKARRQLQKIIKAQGGKITQSTQLKTAKYSFIYRTPKAATLVDLHNDNISRVAKFAGAPQDQNAGLYLHKHQGEKLLANEPILTIYAESKEKLAFAKKILPKAVTLKF